MSSVVFCNYIIIGGYILNFQNKISETDISSATHVSTSWWSFSGLLYAFKICNISLHLK